MQKEHGGGIIDQHRQHQRPQDDGHNGCDVALIIASALSAVIVLVIGIQKDASLRTFIPSGKQL